MIPGRHSRIYYTMFIQSSHAWIIYMANKATRGNPSTHQSRASFEKGRAVVS
jgi:hypothetical protein